MVIPFFRNVLYPPNALPKGMSTPPVLAAIWTSFGAQPWSQPAAEQPGRAAQEKFCSSEVVNSVMSVAATASLRQPYDQTPYELEKGPVMLATASVFAL
jgi:hypothetical protein